MRLLRERLKPVLTPTPQSSVTRSSKLTEAIAIEVGTNHRAVLDLKHEPEREINPARAGTAGEAQVGLRNGCVAENFIEPVGSRIGGWVPH